MEIFFLGQQSPRHPFAQILGFVQASATRVTASWWRSWMRIAVLCAVFHLWVVTGGMCTPPGPRVAAICDDMYANTWSVSVEVSGLSSSTAIVVDRLHEELDAFAGFESEHSVVANRLSFTLIGHSSTMPADADVAIITIWDPAGGGQQRWVVRTDGSGTVITLDGL